MAYFLAVLIIGVCVFSGLESVDLGVHGQLFPVLEKDLMTLLRERLKNLSPEKKRKFQERLQETYVKMLQDPPPVTGVKPCRKYRSYLFNPTVTVRQDVLDHEGRVVVPTGMEVNPLDYSSLEGGLLFFDGANEKQVAWARKQSDDAKWILVGGRPIELEEKEGRGVYFDQRGVYVHHFGLRSVPAKITQQGKQFLVEEILVP